LQVFHHRRIKSLAANAGLRIRLQIARGLQILRCIYIQFNLPVALSSLEVAVSRLAIRRVDSERIHFDSLKPFTFAFELLSK